MFKLKLGMLQYVRGQTIDELILLSQQPEDAKSKSVIFYNRGIR